MNCRIGNFIYYLTLFVDSLLMLAMTVALVTAQSEPPVAVRGTVALIKDQDLIIASTAGDMRVIVSDKTVIRNELPIKFSEISPGMYLGTTATKQADGNFLASEVHV